MKSLTDIIAEVQAIDATNVDAVQAAVAQIVTDLQALQGAQPAADPVVSVVTTTQSGVTATFVPQA